MPIPMMMMMMMMMVVVVTIYPVRGPVQPVTATASPLADHQGGQSYGNVEPYVRIPIHIPQHDTGTSHNRNHSGTEKKPHKPARHPRKWGWQHYCAACLQVKYCDADIRFEMQVTDTGLGERAVRQFDFARRRLDVWAGVFVTVVGADRGCQFGLRLAVGARSAWRGVGCEALRRCEGEGA